MNSKAASTEQKRQAPWAWYAAAVLLFCADRLLKAAALAGVQAGARGTAEFTLFMNTGIAFSIPVADALFWPAAVTALVALVWMFARAFRTAPVTAAIVFFILAGAASNLLDRITHDATVDYLLFFGRSAVNLADGMILGGLVLLATRHDDAVSEHIEH
jgi:lipoprotein signal peptidase